MSDLGGQSGFGGEHFDRWFAANSTSSADIRCAQFVHNLVNGLHSVNFKAVQSKKKRESRALAMNHEIALAHAAQQVRKGKLLVVQQHGRIAKLKATGESTLNAELALDIFQYTLKMLEDSARKIRELG